MKKKILSAVAMATWLIVIGIFMLLAQRVDLEIFFVLWLIGTLVIVEVTDTRFIHPAHLRYIKYLVAAGIIVFGVIVAQKVMEILSK
jgi:hypothetical protein